MYSFTYNLEYSCILLQTVPNHRPCQESRSFKEVGKIAAACVWTNPKPEFTELKKISVYGEREGVRVWVWIWVRVWVGVYPACMWRSADSLWALLSPAMCIPGFELRSSGLLAARSSRAILPTLDLLRVVPHCMIM